MVIANWANRTMWTGEQPRHHRMNSESVDLIYLDPPFNSNRDYSAPIGSEAAGAAFKDTWTLDDIDLAWHGEIATEPRFTDQRGWRRPQSGLLHQERTRSTNGDRRTQPATFRGERHTLKLVNQY